METGKLIGPKGNVLNVKKIGSSLNINDPSNKTEHVYYIKNKSFILNFKKFRHTGKRTIFLNTV